MILEVRALQASKEGCERQQGFGYDTESNTEGLLGCNQKPLWDAEHYRLLHRRKLTLRSSGLAYNYLVVNLLWYFTRWPLCSEIRLPLSYAPCALAFPEWVDLPFVPSTFFPPVCLGKAIPSIRAVTGHRGGRGSCPGTGHFLSIYFPLQKSGILLIPQLLVLWVTSTSK